jgi:hypothetical protein
MGKSSVIKGKRFERQVAKDLRGIFPDARRGMQARHGGDAPDVDHAGPLWPECKHGKRPNIPAALEQATIAAKGTGRVPIAVCRRDHCDATVTLWWEDFLALLEEWKERGDA